MPRKARSRLGSKEIEVPYPEVKFGIKKFEIEWGLRHPRTPTPPQREVAAALKIHENSWSKFVNGRMRPSLYHCIPIARYFDVPLDEVLHAFGYDNLDTLIEETKKSDWVDKKTILDILQFAKQSKEWKAASWKTVMWKRRAEDDLVADVDTHTRAQNYALDVFGWMSDAERDLPFSSHSTDNLPVIAS